MFNKLIPLIFIVKAVFFSMNEELFQNDHFS